MIISTLKISQGILVLRFSSKSILNHNYVKVRLFPPKKRLRCATLDRCIFSAQFSVPHITFAGPLLLSIDYSHQTQGKRIIPEILSKPTHIALEIRHCWPTLVRDSLVRIRTPCMADEHNQSLLRTRGTRPFLRQKIGVVFDVLQRAVR